MPGKDNRPFENVPIELRPKLKGVTPESRFWSILTIVLIVALFGTAVTIVFKIGEKVERESLRKEEVNHVR